jgi:Domain of unknown function (DUF4926)
MATATPDFSMGCQVGRARIPRQRRLPSFGRLRHEPVDSTPDNVALTEDLPQRKLYRGQVSTVVETLGAGICEVEFAEDNGRTYASLALRVHQLMVLHYQPVEAA